ncbi:ABC transporter permease [Terasakiispira papahanaumokuakeensis]|nr:ABC transporter permease [Terasakiispira papahanaumokuakeensis]
MKRVMVSIVSIVTRSDDTGKSYRLALFMAIVVTLMIWGGGALPDTMMAVNPAQRSLAPSWQHWLGTDLLGRDMASRTLAGLAQSLKVGLLAAALSTLLAMVMGMMAALNRSLDRLVSSLTDMMLGMPHFVLLIMVAYAFGGGTVGVTWAVALTHWPRLARLLRHEAKTLVKSDYVQVSRSLGRSNLWLARHHLMPHLMPQWIAGFVVIFPHAILHEAGLSFIGLGIEPHLPSIGVMLANSLNAMLAGFWWVVLAPGLGLMLVAFGFERLGERLRRQALPPDRGSSGVSPGQVA